MLCLQIVFKPIVLASNQQMSQSEIQNKIFSQIVEHCLNNLDFSINHVLGSDFSSCQQTHPLKRLNESTCMFLACNTLYINGCVPELICFVWPRRQGKNHYQFTTSDKLRNGSLNANWSKHKTDSGSYTINMKDRLDGFLEIGCHIPVERNLLGG